MFKLEILDICDEFGNPTGKVEDREIIHQEGLLHRTAHVWLLRKKNNQIEILLQKRSDAKDSSVSYTHLTLPTILRV